MSCKMQMAPLRPPGSAHLQQLASLCCSPQVRSGGQRRAEKRVFQMETEHEALLSSLGEELDSACRSLARNGEDKLQVFPLLTVMQDAEFS